MRAESFAKLYPFRSNLLKLGQHRYHYLDEGQGPALIMLHGNPTWSFYYRELIKGLRDEFRVIVPDHMGCGYSDKPRRYPYRLETHINNLRILVEFLGLKDYSLAMHDWGGPIGLGLAVEAPAKVNKLVVFNTTCELDADYPWQIRFCRCPILGALAVRGLNLFARMATAIACKNRAKMTPAVKAGYLAPYDSYAHRIAIHRFVQDIPLSKLHPTRAFGAQLAHELDTLKDKPMLICWGDRDFCFTEKFLHAWTRRFPEAELHRFPQAGHYVVEDAADQILPLLQSFLANPD